MLSSFSPSFDLAEVEGGGPVGDGLLAEVLGVPPDERGHVVPWKRTNSAINFPSIFMTMK